MGDRYGEIYVEVKGCGIGVSGGFGWGVGGITYITCMSKVKRMTREVKAC